MITAEYVHEGEYWYATVYHPAGILKGAGKTKAEAFQNAIALLDPC